MIKRVAVIGLLAVVIFQGAGFADAADPPVMDSRYIKEHFPEVYQQIYQEGRDAGKKDAEAALQGGAASTQTSFAAPEPASASAPVPEPATQTASVSAPVNPETAPAAAQPAKAGLGAWWEKNSLKYTPLPEQWLFHIEGTMDYKHRTGNTQSDLYNGSASLMVRKLRFTNTLAYIINKEFTKQNPQPGSPVSLTDTDYRSIQDSLRFDLTDRLYSEAGYIWEMDTANYISGRESYYAGFGYALVDTQRHLLDVLLAGGYEEEKYPQAVKAAMNMDSGSVTAGYFRETYRWNVTDRITYKQTFRIIQNFTPTNVFNNNLTNLQVIGETNRNRWFLINEIYFKLVDHLNFMTGFKIEYDSNPWPTVERLDTTLKSGIQLSF